MKRAITTILMIILALFLVSCTGGEMKTAVFDTNMGTIEIDLYTDKMPITTQNFIDLAEKEFYDGTRFHRVISEFMIQGGDPLSKDTSKKNRWGTGDPGYKIKDEFDSSLSNVPGTIAMANAGPNTGGSQFFINLVNNNFLDSKHPVFGKVVKGMEIVEKIGKTRTAQADQPVEDVIIEKVIIK
jgi:peptidylprolyl isomerase